MKILVRQLNIWPRYICVKTGGGPRALQQKFMWTAVIFNCYLDKPVPLGQAFPHLPWGLHSQSDFHFLINMHDINLISSIVLLDTLKPYDWFGKPWFRVSAWIAILTFNGKIICLILELHIQLSLNWISGKRKGEGGGGGNCPLIFSWWPCLCILTSWSLAAFKRQSWRDHPVDSIVASPQSGTVWEERLAAAPRTGCYRSNCSCVKFCR